jgi:hypothetical protein
VGGVEGGVEDRQLAGDGLEQGARDAADGVAGAPGEVEQTLDDAGEADVFIVVDRAHGPARTDQKVRSHDSSRGSCCRPC